MKYGPLLKTGEAELFTMEILEISRAEKAAGRKGIPVTSWGEAGIGKTELPAYLVKKYKEFFGWTPDSGKESGNIVFVPMAQIEEKAELQGLPDLTTLIRDLLPGEDQSNVNGIVKEISETIYVTDEAGVILMNEGLPVQKIITKKVVVTSRTHYAPPSWIPQVETHGEKGILVIDDMNRADSRIMNSIMQLLQDGALLGWSLPEGWEIYCTCNPDNNEYQVTSLDGAQMTRMANFQQEFDPLSWAENWATPTGLHPLAINFVLAYPESVVKGERTNPRSFDKFFRIAAPYFTDPADHVIKIRQFGLMNVDADPLSVFISFITDGWGKLPEITDILDGKVDLDELERKLTKNGTLRVDILNSLSCRIILHLNSNTLKKSQYEGMRAWLKHKMVPGEIRYKDTKIAVTKDPGIGDSELASLIFRKMGK